MSKSLAPSTTVGVSASGGRDRRQPSSNNPHYSDGLGLSVTKSIEDGTLESLMARASMSGRENEPVLDQTVHARQAITPALEFRDSRLELLYQMDYFAKYIKLMRRSIVIGTCLWALFVINDIIKENQGRRRNFSATVSLRFGVIALALVALALTFSQKFGRRSLTWLIVTVIILFGAAQVVSGVIETDTTDPTYSVAIVVISSTSSAFFRLPCMASIFCNLGLYVIYVIVTGATGAYDSATHFGTTCLWLLIGVLIFSLHAYDREWYIRSSYLAQRRLEYEEHKSQKVLLKMLPASVIEQLRSGAEFMHERHSNISVLFSHICEFDEHTSSMSPNEVIGLLNHIFSRFDSITDEFGVYKVETIGDVYLVSAGVPEPRDDHANALAHVAVSMMEALPEFQSVERAAVQLKIGINSGPVIAGVVGMKYPRFRLMGDVVNVASRMSTTCKAGDIQLTPACFQQLKPDEFIIQYRGEIEVKGKGKMKTYLVKGRAASLVDVVCDLETKKIVDIPHSGSTSTERTFIGTPRTPLMTTESLSKGQPAGMNLSNMTPRTSTQPSPAANPQSARSSPPTQQQQQPVDNQIQVTDPSTMLDAPPLGWASPPGSTATQQADLTFSPSTQPAGAAHADKSSVRIHLPNHKSRTESSTSPRNVSQVASATGVQLENLSVVPGFGTGEESDYVAATGPSQLMYRTSSVPVNMSYGGPKGHARIGSGAAGAGASGNSTSPQPAGVGPSNVHYNRAASMVELEPTPGDEVKPSGGLVTNQVIRLGNMTSPKDQRTGGGGSNNKKSAASPAKPALMAQASTAARGTDDASGTSGTNATNTNGPTNSKDILRITAKDVQVEGLFNSIEWETLTDPKNPFSLKFKNHPELEQQFQADFFRKFLSPNRRGLLSFLVAMLLLGIYETLFNLPETSDESETMSLTWIFRLVGLVTGLAGYIFTYTHTAIYEKYQQPILTVTWGIMGCVLISNFIALDSYLDVYGVTCVLLLLTMTSTFVGLQFIWVSCVTIFFLIWYLGGALIIYGAFPLVVFFLIASNVLAITASRSSEYYLRWDYIRHLKLQNEERRTRHFLDNMLPKSVIQEIKLDNSFIAHEFLKASVMFSDIVSFTSIASLMAPEDVVAVLNVMFSTFDALTSKHNVYKVETIGDAYLACSGVVQRSQTQTCDLVRFALDLQTSTKYMHTPDGQPIIIRIGIHTGSVVAGVVGRKMPRYHLFGETVTIAEEMEQNGIPGHVVFSQATHEECEGFFEVEKLEPITLHAKPAKNVLPGDATKEQHAAAAAAAESRTLVHRYKVLAYLGNMALKGGIGGVDDHKPSGRQLPSNDSSAGLMSGSGSGAQRRSRPSSAQLKDEGDRAPPPFVSNILGKINAVNFAAAAERLERAQQRAELKAAAATAAAVSPKSSNGGVVRIVD